MVSQQVTTSKRLIHNTFFNVVTLFASAVINFFLIRFFLGQLGESQYGIWVLIGSIFQYRRLLSMGMNSSINRYIPVALAQNDDRGIQRIVTTSLFFFSALSIVFVLITLVIYYNIGSWFVIDHDMVSTVGVLVLIVGLCFTLAMPLQLSSALLSGLQRYDVLNLAELVILVLRTIILVLLLLRGYRLLTMGLAFGFSEIIVRVVQLIFARKLLPRIRISFNNIDFKLLRGMLAYGMNTFLYSIGALIICKASDLVIGIFMGTAQISQFAVVVSVILLLSYFLRAFTAAIKPAVSDLDARNEHTRIREIAFLTQKYSLLLIIPAGCFLVLMGKEFLWVWVGEKFQDPTVINSMGLILAILTVGHCLRLAQVSNFLVLVGRGEHRVFGVFTVLMALLCVSASVVSVKVLNWGLLGIAWSNFLPMVLISGGILPIYFNWKMKIPTRDSIFRVWWPALLGCLPSIAVISVWKYLAPPDSWPEILAVVVAGMVVTFAGSWFLSFSDLERKRFLRILVRS